ncbi:hypothetical protein [Henriciella aquimarina]|uniref:hypothetical protein n=1 Tax=Henriciella aquimarina TaxID=545261 RepID=UPI000A02ED0B|nr:hypothetical protein [Henriciella aquimarina]
MTNQQRAKLRTIVSQIALELRAKGAMTTRALVEEVMDRHADLIEDAKDMLMKEALAGWARRALKSDRDELKSPQFEMPYELAGVKLPAAIAIPYTDDDDEDAPLWTPIEDASFSQLEANLSMLRGQIAADMRKLQSIEQLHNYLAPFMADERRDDPIGLVLREQAAKPIPKSA